MDPHEYSIKLCNEVWKLLGFSIGINKIKIIRLKNSGIIIIRLKNSGIIVTQIPAIRNMEQV